MNETGHHEPQEGSPDREAHDIVPAAPGCHCPDIDVGQWDDRHISFDQEAFLARPIPQAFHLPVGLADDWRSLLEKADKLNLTLSRPPMLIWRDLGLFKGQLLLGIDADVGPDEAVLLTGKYLTRVYRGPHDRLNRERKQFGRDIAKDLGVRPGEMLCWFANCPRCWTGKGGPATILMARIGNPDVTK